MVDTVYTMNPVRPGLNLKKAIEIIILCILFSMEWEAGGSQFSRGHLGNDNAGTGSDADGGGQGTADSRRATQTTEVGTWQEVNSASEEENSSGSKSMPQTNKLSSTYSQCRAARDALFLDKAIETGTANSLGCCVGGESARVGSFEHEGDAINLCFTGSRVTRGGQICNQSVSLSFDPTNLTCICCEKEHPVLFGVEPVCVCVSDQNFAANISRGDKCIGVIRLESSGLVELTELVQEIFGSNKFPPGSVICVGSVSHLHMVGPTIYCMPRTGFVLWLS